jgi:hypothetical protein
MLLADMVYAPASLVALLRSVLRRLRELPGHDPEDPYFLEWKRFILESVRPHEEQRRDAA